MKVSNPLSNSGFEGATGCTAGAVFANVSNVVPEVGLEPTYLAAADFESAHQNRTYPNKTRRFRSAGLKANGRNFHRTNEKPFKQTGGRNAE